MALTNLLLQRVAGTVGFNVSDDRGVRILSVPHAWLRCEHFVHDDAAVICDFPIYIADWLEPTPLIHRN